MCPVGPESLLEEFDQREMEASRRLLQKLPPVHTSNESPSESEVRSAAHVLWSCNDWTLTVGMAFPHCARGPDVVGELGEPPPVRPTQRKQLARPGGHLHIHRAVGRERIGQQHFALVRRLMPLILGLARPLTWFRAPPLWLRLGLP